MKTTKILHICPGCGKWHDSATAATDPGSVPEPGDVSMCIYCGALGIYVAGDPMTVRATTPQEHDELIQDEAIRRLLAIRARTVGEP